MNKAILQAEVQDFINSHLNADAAKIALSKSPFLTILPGDLAQQILAKKKAEKKLPTWFSTPYIYYPSPLSIEQTSSEITAKHKATIAQGDTLLDLTGGFGVDTFYFAQHYKETVHCEINEELSEIASHNAKTLNSKNIRFLNINGLEFLSSTSKHWDTIYADPARRGSLGKVFKLSDCTPNIPEYLETLFQKTSCFLLKTSPLLDIDAGLKELRGVKEIHVVSTKNECKELLWVMEPTFSGKLKIIASTLNEGLKTFSFYKDDFKPLSLFTGPLHNGLFLYEPDVAVLKSGGQDLVAAHYNLDKLHTNTQLFVSENEMKNFPGRIFKIVKLVDSKELKQGRNLYGNVIVRNYPAKAEDILKKYGIKPAKEEFLIFCKTADEKNVVISGKIIQYY